MPASLGEFTMFARSALCEFAVTVRRTLAVCGMTALFFVVLRHPAIRNAIPEMLQAAPKVGMGMRRAFAMHLMRRLVAVPFRTVAVTT